MKCAQIFQKYGSNVKILVVNVQNLVTTATKIPGFVHPCFTYQRSCCILISDWHISYWNINGNLQLSTSLWNFEH